MISFYQLSRQDSWISTDQDCRILMPYFARIELQVSPRAGSSVCVSRLWRASSSRMFLSPLRFSRPRPKHENLLARNANGNVMVSSLGDLGRHANYTITYISCALQLLYVTFLSNSSLLDEKRL